MKHNKIYSVFISLIVALGGFLLGFDASVISGAVGFYQTDFSLSAGSVLIGFSVSSLILGAVAGNFLAGPLSDKYGRKPVLILTAFLFAYCALQTALAHSIMPFIIGRIVGGLGVGLAIITAPMYIAEIAPSKLRGFLVSFNQLNIVLGISVAYFSNYYILQWIEDPTLNWRWMLGVGLAPAIAYFVLLFIVPESPRWLIQKGKDEQGKKIMVRVGGQEHADSEFAKIKESLNRDINKEKASFKELFTKQMRWVMIIGLGLAFFQQASCINAILYYAPMIFELTGFGKNDAFLQSIYLGLTNFAVTIIAMLLIDKLGRKALLIFGSIVISAALLMVGFSFNNATYTITGAHIDELKNEIYDNSLRNIAKTENAEYYGIDNIKYVDEFGTESSRDEAAIAVMLKDGIELTSIDMTSLNGKSLAIEANGIASRLDKYKNKTYTSETELFNALRADVSGYISDEVTKKLEGDENASFHFLVSQKVDEVKGEGDKKAAQIKEEVTNHMYSFYKDSLVKKSISINGKLVLIALITFIFGFGISFGPVMWTMLSEIFPNRMRGIAFSVAGTFNSVVSFSVATIFPIQLEFLGSATTYLIYGFIMATSLFFILKFVPETKGQSLEDLEGKLISRH